MNKMTAVENNICSCISAAYPCSNAMLVVNKRTRSNAEVRAAERVEEKSELELFQEFYELQNNQPMTEVQEQFVEELLRGMKE